MAAEEDVNSIPQTEEDLLAKHKKERKELLAHTQKLKHGVPKGDKKKKKEVMAEVARLEAELDEKQEKERQQFSASQVTEKQENEPEKIDKTETAQPEMKKLSKAQKRREKKAAEERERAARIEQAEIDNINCARNVEAAKIKKILNEMTLRVHEIPSDGNCLYAAVRHQLSLRDTDRSVTDLRHQAAEHIRSHSDDFLPYLTNPSTGDPLSSDEFAKYCDDIEHTTAWGGQPEIRALANVLKTPIQVVQADTPKVVIGEEFKEDLLTLSYHRHEFGLGEHYNSVIRRTAENDDEDEFS